jgi:hypothetical protein
MSHEKDFDIIQINEDDVFDYYENRMSYALSPPNLGKKTKIDFFREYDSISMFNLATDTLLNNIRNSDTIYLSEWDFTVEPRQKTLIIAKNYVILYFILKYIDRGGIGHIIYEKKRIEMAEAIAPILKYAVEEFELPDTFTQKEDFIRIVKEIRGEVNN